MSIVVSEADRVAEGIRYIQRYGGRCRDCADVGPVCERTGIGCGESERAIRWILGAIEYGAKHGFLTAEQTAALLPETLARHAATARLEGALAMREGAANWLEWGEDQANEDLCNAVWALVKQQNADKTFVAHPYFVLFATAIRNLDPISGEGGE